MLGAIIGDIVGSRFEWHNIKTKDFDFITGDSFKTDDTVMTVAIAKAIMESKDDYSDLGEKAINNMQKLGRLYPGYGYGGHFVEWIYSENPQPYNSWGNGSAMRVSPCGFVAESLEEAEMLAEKVTKVTHNHEEGIKGAVATAKAIFLAREGKSIKEIREYLSDYYKVDFTLDDIRDEYTFDVSCMGTLPVALASFYESTGFEDAIRNAISIGGDSDTIAAITGAIAEAYYGIPDAIKDQAISLLDELMLDIYAQFSARYL